MSAIQKGKIDWKNVKTGKKRLHYLIKYSLKSIPSQPMLFMPKADDA
jgi:hypothetical protein